MLLLAPLAACDRVPDLEPAKRVQLSCRSSSPAEISMVFVLDTGDRSVRWVNGAETQRGVVAVEPLHYRLTFDGPAPWQASINRFDGTMTRSANGAGARPLPGVFDCQPDTEGAKF